MNYPTSRLVLNSPRSAPFSQVIMARLIQQNQVLFAERLRSSQRISRVEPLPDGVETLLIHDAQQLQSQGERTKPVTGVWAFTSANGRRPK